MRSYKLGLKDGRRWPGVLLFLAVLLGVGGVAAFLGVRSLYMRNLQAVDPGAAQEIIYVLERGSMPPQIAKELREKALIRSATAFEQYVRTNELGEEFKAGTYVLKQSMDVPAIVQILTEGRVAANLFTIIPGTRLKDIKEDLLKKDFSQAEIDTAFDPNKYAGHPALVDKPGGASLEGYLYPDSYEFLLGTTRVETIITQSLDEMARALTPEVRAGMAAQGLSVYQGIILASIVEGEVSSSEDRAKVAQVFLKRLDTGMRLESNATDEISAELGDQYNTYRIDGLPPEPVSNTTVSSLRAVAGPAQTDFLYFVSGRDCITRFSSDIGTHETLIDQHGLSTEAGAGCRN
ncbi:MAG: endolytic transglycosylase MltG [Candidatus Saccharimonadales bacterium]